MKSIGFIGLGHMGTPMVKSLLKQGYQVKIFDVVADAVAACAEDGAIPTLSLSELASDAEVIFTMLPTGQDVENVWLNQAGLLNHAKPGTLLIDSSSIDVQTTRRLADLAEKKGLHVLDAPVSGGVAGAKAGTLTFMVGGNEEDFLTAKPILASMGTTIVHAGPHGNGQAAKICNNMILGISMIAVSEAFTLAKKLGLSAEKLFEISSHASGQCWSMTSYCPVPGLVATSPANYNYAPGFTAQMMLKDLYLSQQAAQMSHTSTPLGALATELYNLFVNQQHGQLDFSAIINMIAGKE